jgi:protein-L-isoaspartate(D-aspartate) O-methyltransferase
MLTTVDAAQRVPERHYTHHPGRGETQMRSNPQVIHREVATLEAAEGMRVCEIGTGSGYSGGLLAALVGPHGQVTSLDIDRYLVQWATVIHHELGLTNIACVAADGTRGFPAAAPYDRLVAWCTPPSLPAAWVDQITDGGIIVTPLPIATVPHLTVVAKIRVAGGQPHVEAVSHGGYMETTSAPHDDDDVPRRWVDWEYRVPEPTWISIAWRDHV